jgi:hypothetical protein
MQIVDTTIVGRLGKIGRMSTWLIDWQATVTIHGMRKDHAEDQETAVGYTTQREDNVTEC